MKFGVVIFPGSNCDRDMIHVLRNVMQQEVHEIWHKDETLPNFTSEDCVVLPGGFSYGDYLRTGAIARFSPIMQAVITHAENGGKVFGICNGFQILCEAGLLPGGLVRNDHQKFTCKNVYLKTENNTSILTSNMQVGEVVKIPIAHAEGRFIANESTIQSLIDNQQVIYTYCNENGEVSPEDNPNGSINNIAGICNKTGNIAGMMPHPERAAEDNLGNTHGLKVMQSLLNFVKTTA